MITLFCGNVSYDLTQDHLDELKEKFAEFGRVYDFRAPRDKETRKFNGHVFVDSLDRPTANLRAAIDSLPPMPVLSGSFIVAAPTQKFLEWQMRQICGAFGIPHVYLSNYLPVRALLKLPARAGRTRKGWRQAHAWAMNQRRRQQRINDLTCYLIPDQGNLATATSLDRPTELVFQSVDLREGSRD